MVTNSRHSHICNIYFITRVKRSAKCKVWRVSRDADVKTHDLGGVIAQLHKGRKTVDAIYIRKTRGTEFQGREVRVRQLCVKREVQTLKTESGMDFKSDSGSLGLYLQHIFKNQPWLLRESGEIA